MTSPTLQRFIFSAIDAHGARVTDEMLAVDKTSAIAKLAESGFTTHQIRAASSARGALFVNRASEQELRVFVLRQLGTMAGAGIELLEAVELLIEVTPTSIVREELVECAAAIRRGVQFSTAFQSSVRDYPAYVYALMQAGDASGRFAELMMVAADELAFEQRIKKEIENALAYPIFLLCTGSIILGVLFYYVVPEFAKMLTGQSAQLGLMERLVFALGLGVRAHGPFLLAVAIGLAISIFALLRRYPSLIKSAADWSARLPFVRDVFAARWRMNWARILGVALQAGLNIVYALELAESATGSSLKRKLVQARSNLKNGQSVEVAFSNALDAIDAGLLKVGQKTGSLAAMCGHVSKRHEALFRDSVRRFNALLEPLAIGLIALAIGAVALSLVSAMTSLYDAVG